MKRILNAVILVATAMMVANVHAAADPAAAPAPTATAAGTTLASDLFTNVIIAKGKGFEITRAQLDNEMIYARSSAAARGQNIPPEQMGMIEKQLLQQLIFIRALNAKASDDDKATGKTNADKQFNEMLAQVSTNATLAAALESRLASVGLTRDQLHQQWLDRAVMDAVVRRELNVKVTDGDVKAYYTNNPAQFEVPEMAHVAHLLLMTKEMDTGKDLPDEQKAAKHKTMEDLLKRARGGESFSNLVQQYSEDPGSKNNGGEYTFARSSAGDSGMHMVLEFEAASFSLKTNQISDIVTTMYGYHIIKLLEKIPAKKYELEKVATEVKDMLEQQAIFKQIPDYMKKVQKEADVQILDASLKPLVESMPDVPVPNP